jgi:hypothetical protein
MLTLTTNAAFLGTKSAVHKESAVQDPSVTNMDFAIHLWNGCSKILLVFVKQVVAPRPRKKRNCTTVVMITKAEYKVTAMMGTFALEHRGLRIVRSMNP